MSVAYDHGAPASSFGVAAEAYERGRPTYPGEVIDWLLPAGTRDVLDLGAGTGKLTAGLVPRGLDVVAVDPSPAMLDRLRAVVPGARALVGTGEQIPLAAASVDAVLVAQAWHWVDPVRAVPEIARVLRPGGSLGLLPAADRRALLDAVRELLASHPDGDHADPASLPTAFAGADQLLVSSNDPAADAVALHRVAVEAAVAAEVGRILYTSHQGASPDTPFGPGRDHAATEEVLAASGTAWTAREDAAQVAAGQPEGAARFTLTLHEAARDGFFAGTNPLLATLLGREPRTVGDQLTAPSAH